TNRIPFARGLGSSSAAIACGVLIANHCLGSPLTEAGLVDLATALEGHPDNVVPCLLGGVRVATLAETSRVVHARVPLALSLRADAVGAAFAATAQRLGEPGQTLQMALIDRGAHVVAA